MHRPVCPFVAWLAPGTLLLPLGTVITFGGCLGFVCPPEGGGGGGGFGVTCAISIFAPPRAGRFDIDLSSPAASANAELNIIGMTTPNSLFILAPLVL